MQIMIYTNAIFKYLCNPSQCLNHPHRSTDICLNKELYLYNYRIYLDKAHCNCKVQFPLQEIASHTSSCSFSLYMKNSCNLQYHIRQRIIIFHIII